jgi:hypothetical protein
MSGPGARCLHGVRRALMIATASKDLVAHSGAGRPVPLNPRSLPSLEFAAWQSRWARPLGRERGHGSTLSLPCETRGFPAFSLGFSLRDGSMAI